MHSSCLWFAQGSEWQSLVPRGRWPPLALLCRVMLPPNQGIAVGCMQGLRMARRKRGEHGMVPDRGIAVGWMWGLRMARRKRGEHGTIPVH